MSSPVLVVLRLRRCPRRLEGAEGALRTFMGMLGIFEGIIAGLEGGERFLATDHELEAEAKVVEIGAEWAVVVVVSAFWEAGHRDSRSRP